MFCSNCGSKLSDGARFCSVCGNRVAAVETPWSDLNQTRDACADCFTEPEYSPVPPAQPAVKNTNTAADRAFEPAYSPAPQRPAGKKGKGGAKVLIGIVAVAALVAGAVFGLRALTGKSLAPAPLGEFAPGDNSNYCLLTQSNGAYVIRKVITSKAEESEKLWADISKLEITPTETDFSDEVYAQPHLEVSLLSGNRHTGITVTEDGRLVVLAYHETRCYTGAQEVYEKLYSWIPPGESVELAASIPDSGIASMAIYLWDEEGNIITRGYTTDQALIGTITQQLRQQRALLGGGTYSDYDDATVNLVLNMENGVTYEMYIQADGNGDIPMGLWRWGIYDGRALYEMIRDWIELIKE